MHDGNVLTQLAAQLSDWAAELGFSALGMAAAHDAELRNAHARYADWLKQGRHGEMDYMARNADLRARPESLLANAQSVISVALAYWPEQGLARALSTLAHPERAYISRYALGRDYHKIMRRRLNALARRMESAIGPFAWRVCVDSAPVLEVAFARQGGLGWRGKHTLLLSRQGSFHFLGELYTSLPPPAGEKPAVSHCGTCNRCLRACPTQAIVAPYEVDARRCIAYLTIEHPGSIPEALRPAVGNRIYGCDDCQIVCPWNRSAPAGDAAFLCRDALALDAASLVELMAWEETDFLDKLTGSPIRRIGHQRWLRNIAVALGNCPPKPEVLRALGARIEHPSALVREHVGWALARIRGGNAANAHPP
ncbi:MAG: tRNA epoxyqueuosine(34) reductase QueG [Zoogloeaceae bacterium]|jgi:epoxyqueuosine reductase|nr:tRNA epoxyqueuosine(34) reductase QueG [Zoogloeaceae bacterium]